MQSKRAATKTPTGQYSSHCVYFSSQFLRQHDGGHEEGQAQQHKRKGDKRTIAASPTMKGPMKKAALVVSAEASDCAAPVSPLRRFTMKVFLKQDSAYPSSEKKEFICALYTEYCEASSGSIRVVLVRSEQKVLTPVVRVDVVMQLLRRRWTLVSGWSWVAVYARRERRRVAKRARICFFERSIENIIEEEYQKTNFEITPQAPIAIPQKKIPIYPPPYLCIIFVNYFLDIGQNSRFVQTFLFIEFTFHIITQMKDSTKSALSLPQLQSIMDSLLKIPRRHTLIHPCQERTKYANILDWLTGSLSGLKDQKLAAEELTSKQQQLITSSLSELIELTSKECVQKGIILEMILEYFISTLNAYWKHFSSSSSYLKYEYEHNTFQIEKTYINEIKSLNRELEELKKDKDHRWRNMFMLIKDNRILRRQNKKLLKCVNEGVEKECGMVQQMLNNEAESQRLKIRLAQFQEENIEMVGFIEANIKFSELEMKIRQYPKKSKKMLKNDLLKIETQQNKGLKDKIDFIINAIQETGTIIEDLYDDDPVLQNLQFNISTQTESNVEDRGVNTMATKVCDQELQTYNYEHAKLDMVDTVELKVIPKKDRKDREVRNAMFATAQSFSKYNFSNKKQEPKSRNLSKKIIKDFSIVESLKITILESRIGYISTYNTEQFNGLALIKQIEKKVQTELKQKKLEKRHHPKLAQKHTQTMEGASPSAIPLLQQTNITSITNMTMRPTIKSFARMATLKDLPSYEKKSSKSNQHKIIERYFEISQEAHFYFDPEEYKKKEMKKSGERSESIRSSLVKKINSREKLRDSKRNFDKEVKFAIKKSQRIDTREKQSVQDILDDALDIDIKTFNNLKNFDEVKQTKETMEIKEPATVDATIHEETPNISSITKLCSLTTEEPSGVMSPLDFKEIRSQIKSKKFNNTSDSLKNHLTKPSSPSKRNLSSISPSLITHKKIGSSRALAKISSKNLQHRRTATEADSFQNFRTVTMASQQFSNLDSTSAKKPLHRISEDLTEYEKVIDSRAIAPWTANQPFSPNKSAKILFSHKKEQEQMLKEIDFSKIIDKMLKNIDTRYNEVSNNSHTFKIYLSSFFKCSYGKQLYPNFLNYLSRNPELHTTQDELLVTFNKLSNPKLPLGYSSDMFKTFAATVHKCYQASEHPLSYHNRLDILKYMVGQFYEEEETIAFQGRMKKQGCFNLVSWFNCLEFQVRSRVIHSELYGFLQDVALETQDCISRETLEELAFFIGSDPLVYQPLVKAHFQVGAKTPFHRFCLFCLRNKWSRMLNISSTLTQQYTNKIGLFSYQKSLKQVKDYLVDLEAFKTLEKWIHYWLCLSKKYKIQINTSLLMLCELTILEVKLRQQLPLSRELKLLNLSFDGLIKRRYFEQTKQLI